VKTRYPALIVCALLATPGLAADLDLAALTGLCESCHGPGGLSTDSDVPIIAGQTVSLIENAHEQFKDMARPCTRTELRHGSEEQAPTSMCEVSAGLDGPTIEAIAQHYASLEFVPAQQEFDEAQAVAGAALHELYCESCHPEGGSTTGFAGRLAGQWTPYLRGTIDQIIQGEVIVPHIMERKLAEFSSEEIDALLNFWASQRE
jgi:sulfide dehydrogenase cytochrome subunit